MTRGNDAQRRLSGGKSLNSRGALVRFGLGCKAKVLGERTRAPWLW